MSKLKIKNTEKQDENEADTPIPATDKPITTPSPEPTTDYGVGGVYRSIGGGKRAKV